MPTYEFLCATCGPFEQRRSLQEAGDPMLCPTCAVVAQRLYSTSGVILSTAAAHCSIEQRAEPTVVTRHVSEPSRPAPTLQQSAHHRPWQLGHATHARPVKPGLRRI